SEVTMTGTRAMIAASLAHVFAVKRYVWAMSIRSRRMSATRLAMRRRSSFARLRSVNTGTPADSISAETRPGRKQTTMGTYRSRSSRLTSSRICCSVPPMSSSSMMNSTRARRSMLAPLDGSRGASPTEVTHEPLEPRHFPCLEEADRIEYERGAEEEARLARERGGHRSPRDQAAHGVDADAHDGEPDDASPLVGNGIEPMPDQDLDDKLVHVREEGGPGRAHH